LDAEILVALQPLKVKSLLGRSGIMKKRGYPTVSLLYRLILLPFIMKRTTFRWSGNTMAESEKDVWYRSLNNECVNWRTFIYRLDLKMIAFYYNTPLKEKTLILDDTIYHFDHTTQGSVLGYQSGKQLFPHDAEIHVSTSRPNTNVKSMDKQTSC